jgi:hypothetical protein
MISQGLLGEVEHLLLVEDYLLTVGALAALESTAPCI